MKIEKLLEFYKNCFSLGFVRIDFDEKSNYSISIYAPTKEKVDKTKSCNIFLLDTTDTEFYMNIKKYCWISRKRSHKNIIKLQNYIKKLEDKYRNYNLEYNLKFKSNSVIISVNIKDLIVKEKSLRLRLFTTNYGKRKFINNSINNR